MDKVVGIRFKPAGKIYDFECGHYVLNINDKVIVSTEQGFGFGVVATLPIQLSERESKSPLKKIFRLATDEDIKQKENNTTLETTAKDFCQKCINELELKMNLFSVESTFDTSKLTFFFTAEGRVDFRQLVKMLVKEFRVRIEMRQVGIRNQAKMCGAIGRCGREICCSSFMEKFEPVSIRMAKEQDLSLNPTKISGLCSRLMCCLTFESETYKYLKKNTPGKGKHVKTSYGSGVIIRQNLLQRKVTVRFEDGSDQEIEIADIKNIEE